jgi:DNA-binding response OmpR family regulator
MRILIIEDEFNLADVIASRLKKEQYAVDVFCDGEVGLDNALTNIYDLIILDVMLPKINGFEILKEIKKEGINSKVIMLTAKSMLEDKLNGLENGANDYLTKPFHMDELVARVNVQLRNDNSQKSKDYIEVGDLKLNIKTTNLTCIKTNETINIICKEFLLLEYFMKNPNQIISREQIYDKIWGIDNEIESNNLEAYISFVRKKLKIIGSTVQIKAMRGLGYKLEV